MRCVFFWSHIDLCVHNNKDSGNDYDNDSELERDNYALVLNNNNNGKGNGNSYGNDMTVNLKMLNVTMTWSVAGEYRAGPHLWSLQSFWAW